MGECRQRVADYYIAVCRRFALLVVLLPGTIHICVVPMIPSDGNAMPGNLARDDYFPI